MKAEGVLVNTRGLVVMLVGLLFLSAIQAVLSGFLTEYLLFEEQKKKLVWWVKDNISSSTKTGRCGSKYSVSKNKRKRRKKK